MVLDDASIVGSDEISDGAPMSDSDPYASSDTRVHLELDGRKLPQPIPIIGPLFGYNRDFLVKAVMDFFVPLEDKH